MADHVLVLNGLDVWSWRKLAFAARNDFPVVAYSKCGVLMPRIERHPKPGGGSSSVGMCVSRTAVEWHLSCCISHKGLDERIGVGAFLVSIST